MRRCDWLTFDCYGTLVDWERGIADAFVAAAGADGVRLERAAVLTAYHDVEPVVQAERYRSYREVLEESARRVAARLGWSLADSHAGFLSASLASWPPFPDTNAALRRLRAAGHRLGILSNVDDDLLAGTRRHLAVDFDLIVTAEQVGTYKPAPGHFVAARARIGEARWLHVAQSFFHDIRPARELGVPVVWINRRGEPPLDERPPEREFADLAAAAAWLTDGT